MKTLFKLSLKHVLIVFCVFVFILLICLSMKDAGDFVFIILYSLFNLVYFLLLVVRYIRNFKLFVVNLFAFIAINVICVLLFLLISYIKTSRNEVGVSPISELMS